MPASCSADSSIYTWLAGSGTWSTTADWSPTGLPASGDDAQIVDSDDVAVTVTYNYTGSAVTLATLSLDLTGYAAGTTVPSDALLISANQLLATNEYVGYAGSGSVNQSGGSNTCGVSGTRSLELAYEAGSIGSYTMSGGTLSSSGEDIGLGGVGTFIQSGGTNTAALVSIGTDTTSSGSSYSLSGTATLNGGSEYVSGGFTQFGAASTNIADSVVVGESAAGSYSLSSGTLTTRLENIGVAGTGTFTQSGGSQSVSQIMDVGSSNGASGNYALKSGSLSVFNERVDSTGTFNQSGGTNTVTGLSGSGLTIYSGGNFNQSGGTLAAANITDNAGGVFTQTGGTISGGASLTIDGSATLAPSANPVNPVAAGTYTPQALGLTVIDSGGMLTVAPAAASSPVVLNVNGLAIAHGGTLDLTNNDLIVSGDSLSQVQLLVNSGYANGAWTGTGITSSTAGVANRTLGVMANNDGNGNAIYSSFDGQSVSSSDVLVKYTLYGDANLDGTVDAADFVLLSNNFGKSGTDWSEGDFNDDGTTDAADFVLLSNNFGQSLTSSAVQYMDASEIAAYNAIAAGYGCSQNQIAAWDVKLSGVPEPGMAWLPVAMLGAAVRRRRGAEQSSVG